MNDEYKSMVEQLVIYRHEVKLSQEDLAAIIGVTNSLVHKWEQYKRIPSGFMLSCWVDSLGCKIEVTKKQDGNRHGYV